MILMLSIPVLDGGLLGVGLLSPDIVSANRKSFVLAFMEEFPLGNWIRGIGAMFGGKLTAAAKGIQNLRY